MQDKSLGSIDLPGKKPHTFKTNTRTLIPLPDKKRTFGRTKTIFFRNSKFILLIVLAGIIALWIYFIPPVNIFTIAPLILLMTLFVFLISSFNRKLQIFASIFTLGFLSISYAVGFDLVSTTILLSFIIVLSTVFKIEK